MTLRRQPLHRPHDVTATAIRRGTFALLFLGAFSSAHGQSFQVGIKSGLNQAGLTDSREFLWNRSPTTAGFIRTTILGPLSLVPELSHLRRTGVSTLGASTLSLTADYVELPVMLQLQLGSAYGLSPFMAMGPSVAYRLRCQLRFVGGGIDSNQDCDVARGTNSRKLDFGVGAGAGLALDLKAVTLSFEARATAGLRTFVLPTDIQGARTTGWSLLGGVSVPFRRMQSTGPVFRPPTAIATLPPARDLSPAPLTLAVPSVTETAARRRITVNADDVEVREVIAAIAEATGYNVVVSSEVRGKVSAALFDVPAEVAVRAIADVAGLSVRGPAVPGQGTVIFRQPVVNINNASPAVISTRYGVSGELAKWTAENRTP